MTSGRSKTRGGSRLSKSQYTRGLQCQKSLWLYNHRRELATPPDARQQAVFDTGHRVGKLAQSLFPGGVEIEHRPDDVDAMVRETRAAMARGDPAIYEATFVTDGILIRADILVRNGEHWDLYEVKSSTGVKPQHLPDVAIQWYVLKAHLRPGRACLVHIDSGYRFDGELELSRLLAIADVTEAVLDLQAGIDARLATMRATLDGPLPDIEIGPHCSNPYGCDFQAYCWRDVPNPSVFDLYRMRGERKFRLYHDGKRHYRDLRGESLTAVQRLQVDTALSGETRVDRKALRAFLDEAVYPLYFLDFETFNAAIPKYLDQQPYRTAIPFQYSLHVLTADGELEHREYLADERADPRPELAARLAGDIGRSGSIVAYSQATERGIIRRLAQERLEQAPALLAMDGRFVDLLRPFQQLMYYHPDFNGSFSIKSVLPALFPDDPALDYKALEIQAGDAASAIYADLDRVADAAERQRIRDALLAYCRLDTLAMVMIWRKLEAAAA